jgi:hypothetical protein
MCHIGSSLQSLPCWGWYQVIDGDDLKAVLCGEDGTRWQAGGRSFVNLVVVRLQRGGRVRSCAGVAVLQAVAPGIGGLANSKPFQKPRVRLRHAVCVRDDHHRPVPEVFVLVVLHKPSDHVAKPTDVGARQTVMLNGEIRNIGGKYG